MLLIKHLQPLTEYRKAYRLSDILSNLVNIICTVSTMRHCSSLGGMGILIFEYSEIQYRL